MRTLMITLLLAVIFPAMGQVVSNVNWELEGNERIVITYDLAKVDNVIYFDVSVKVKIDDKVVAAKSLSGDVGNYVKMGTNKRIVWNMFDDISALNGKLSVEVLAFNPVPTVSHAAADSNQNVQPRMQKLSGPKVPFWAGMGGISITGVGLLTAGIKTASEGQDMYNVYKNNRIESSSVYTDLGSTRDELYEEANKKHKNGTLLQVAGAAVFVAAGVMIVNRMIQIKKVQRRHVAVSPYLKLDPHASLTQGGMSAGLTMQYRFK